jgi:hypothetical protein
VTGRRRHLDGLRQRGQRQISPLDRRIGRDGDRCARSREPIDDAVSVLPGSAPRTGNAVAIDEHDFPIRGAVEHDLRAAKTDRAVSSTRNLR